MLHFSLQDQVAQVPLLCEPNEEFLEGGLDGFFCLMAGDEKTGDVAGPSDPLDSAEEVGFGGVVVAAMLVAELLDAVAVGGAEVLPDDLLGDVSADVLAVVAGLFALDFLLLGLEDLGAEVLVVGVGVVGENEGPLAVGGRADQLAEDGVVGLLAGEPVDGFEDLLFGGSEVELLVCH